MRWNDIVEPIVTKDRHKSVNEDIQQPSTVTDAPTKIEGPVYGVPADEVLAWVESWATKNRLPRPKARRIR